MPVAFACACGSLLELSKYVLLLSDKVELAQSRAPFEEVLITDHAKVGFNKLKLVKLS